MARAIDALAILLFLVAAGAFALGLTALSDLEDFRAIYLLIVGALALRASTELLRPKGSAG